MVQRKKRASQKVTIKERAFNPEMLRIARQSKDKTQAKLSEEIGEHQSKLSKWEDGLLVPDEEALQRLSEALECPVEFFFHSGSIAGFGSCCLYHRKRKSLPVKTLSNLHARVNCLTIGIERLLENASISPKVEFPDFDIDEFGGPEEIAQMVRATWSIPPGPVANLSHFVEAAGAIIVPVSFGTDRLDAVSLWPRMLPPLLFVNRDAPADRQRFNVAHEVGHLVMHRIPTPNAEEEADRFASELLMPSREIKAELRGLSLHKALRLKRKWRASIAALVMKAKETKAITPRKTKTLFTELSRLGYRKVEPGQFEHDECKTLAKLVNAHRTKLKCSIDDLLRLTYCTSEEQFCRRYDPTARPRLRVVR